MSIRRVAIFTGNRAEYGLQLPILKAVRDHPMLDYKLLVSGAHLDKNFGNTLDEIKSDGFDVCAEVKIEMDAKSLFATAQAIGSGIIEISKVLSELKPDIMVVYADRFEGLAAVIASSQMNIPTAHIEGGDITEGGALDDSVRHAMTKLAHLHFTTNQEASNRILGMGEEGWRVNTVGFPAIDLISEGNFATPEEVAFDLKLDLTKPVILFTQHSVTTEFTKSVEQLNPSLVALTRLAEKGVQVLITYPNNDAGGQQIIRRLEDFSKDCHANIKVHRSLGRYLYHGVLSLSQKGVKVACVGNSSSGLKETPAFNCPTVNIGSRQDGRLRGNNVVDSDYSSIQLGLAIEKCLYNEQFKKTCDDAQNPYGMGDAGIKIANVLANVSLGQAMIRKKMTLKGSVNEGWFQ